MPTFDKNFRLERPERTVKKTLDGGKQPQVYQRRTDFAGASPLAPIGGFGNVPTINTTIDPTPENMTQEELLPRTARLGYRTPPELYDKDGKLNPKYDSSIGRDILAGLGMGSKLGMGQDPMFQLGASIGGAIGGIFAKNIAGKQQYMQDAQMIAAYNAQADARTNAEIRLAASELKKTQEDNREKYRQLNYDLRVKGEEAKGMDKTLEVFTSQLALTSDPEARAAIQSAMQSVMARRFGVPAPWLDDPNFGVKWDAFQAGDYWMLRNKNNPAEVREMLGPDGKPLTTLTSEKFIDIYDKLNGTGKAAGANVNPQTMQMALDQARQLVTQNSKGKIKDSQREAMVFNLAQMLVKGGQFSKDINDDSRKQFLKSRLQPLFDSFGVEPAESGQTTEGYTGGNSVFMPSDKPVTNNPAQNQPVTQSNEQVDFTKPFTDDKQVFAFAQTMGNTMTNSKAKSPEELLGDRMRVFTGADKSYFETYWETPKYVDRAYLTKMAKLKGANIDFYQLRGNDKDLFVRVGSSDYVLEDNPIKTKSGEFGAVRYEKDYFADVANDPKKAAGMIGNVLTWGQGQDAVSYLVVEYNVQTGEFKLRRVSKK